MKNIRKYKLLALISLCLAVIFCMSACAPSSGASSNAKDAEGEWGENITWAYTSDDKTLKISGNGNMNDFESSEDVPWADVKTSAEIVKIEDGVTSVAKYAFYGFSALKTAELPDGLTSVGALAFAFCPSLETVDLPSTLTTIGDSAFEWCSALKSINVGSKLTTLGSRAFAFCGALETAYICSPDVELVSETFRGCRSLKNLVLHPTITAGKVYADAFKDTDFDYQNATFSESLDKEITVTVKYIYEDGTAAFEDAVIKTTFGERYTVNSPAKEGYTADRLTVTDIAPANDVTETVTYKKNEAASDTETETSEALSPAEGEDDGPNVLAIVILVLVVAAIGVGAFFLIRSEKREADKQKNQNKAKNRKQK